MKEQVQPFVKTSWHLVALVHILIPIVPLSSPEIHALKFWPQQDQRYIAGFIMWALVTTCEFLYKQVQGIWETGLHVHSDMWEPEDSSVGYHCTGSLFILCMCAQLCPTLWEPMDYSLPGSSVHGIFQIRILECVVIYFSKQCLKIKQICYCDIGQKSGVSLIRLKSRYVQFWAPFWRLEGRIHFPAFSCL